MSDPRLTPTNPPPIAAGRRGEKADPTPDESRLHPFAEKNRSRRENKRIDVAYRRGRAARRAMTVGGAFGRLPQLWDTLAEGTSGVRQ